jgi:malonate-semialdehyde dehydrogenase (acetylating)/methylmalonate-semialdehyde dehydrogenase
MNAPTSTAVLAPTVKLLIGGQFVESKTTAVARRGQPRHARSAGPRALCHAEEINAAVASAKEAFKTWKKTPIGARARIFLKLQQLIRENMGELAALLTAEQGKTLPDAEGDVFRGLEVVEHAAASATCNWASWPTTWPAAWTPTPCCSRWACAPASRRSTSRP